MKPFDLQAAKRGEPLITSRGSPVTEFHHFETELSTWCCVAVVNGACLWTSVSGVISGTHGLTLCMAPKKRTVYINLHKQRDSSEIVPYLYSDELYANSQRGHSTNCLGTFPIEIED